MPSKWRCNLVCSVSSSLPRRCHSHPLTSFGHLYSHLYSTCLFFSHQNSQFFFGFIFLLVLLRTQATIEVFVRTFRHGQMAHVAHTCWRRAPAIPCLQCRQIHLSDLAVLVDAYGPITAGSNAFFIMRQALCHQLAPSTRPHFLVFPNAFY